MERVERACDVYVRFVSAILALAQARSVFDVASHVRLRQHRGAVPSCQPWLQAEGPPERRTL